jgi:hypothetical protein
MLRIQIDQKVKQPTLKYFMAAVQHNLTRLINTQYHCDYTRAHTCHVVTYSHHSSVVFKQLCGRMSFSQLQRESTVENIWHLILTLLARMSLEKHILILLCKQTDNTELRISNISAPSCMKHEDKSEYMHKNDKIYDQLYLRILQIEPLNFFINEF